MDTYMDAYCERTAPGLLNEPLNAITNASFLIAAWAAYYLITDGVVYGRPGNAACGWK
jgi:hypothetical protein